MTTAAPPLLIGGQRAAGTGREVAAHSTRAGWGGGRGP
jgi:hypothetical protein